MFSNYSKWTTPAVQLASVAIALAAAWLLRFDFAFPAPGLVLSVLPVLLICRWMSLSRWQLMHSHWRYTGIGDLGDLAKSIAVGSILFVAVTRIAMFHRSFPDALPLSIYLLEAVLSLLFLSALRVSVVMVQQARAVRTGGTRSEILIVGAGFAGALLLKALHATRYKALGLLDDNRALHGTRICDVPVLGGIDRLPELTLKLGVKEVLIAIPSASGLQMLRISDYCAQANVAYRAVPSVADLIHGKLPITDLRELNLDDLLGREPLRIESAGVSARLQGRVVMVTGAAGSIGSELCRQIVRCAPSKIVCVDQAETPLFHLQQMLLKETTVPVVCAVTNVGDKNRMRHLLHQHQVRIIFNAAAYKHVPMVEENAYEALRNNVFALLGLFEIAEECKCEDFVLISTDKAVNPSSLMGCTKRLGEMIMNGRRQRTMRCVSVRFGNVLGSQGSVVPLFREQIRDGKPITVTHPEVTRYFMTIPEAVCLTLQAFTIGEHGDNLVLDMGEPIRIADLAKALIRISGKTAREIPIVYTGLRPGEKLHESLFYETEKRLPTGLAPVTRAKGRAVDWAYLQQGLRDLEAAMLSHNDYEIRCIMKELIPEYEWTPAPVDVLRAIGPSPEFPPIPQFAFQNAGVNPLYSPDQASYGT